MTPVTPIIGIPTAHTAESITGQAADLRAAEQGEITNSNLERHMLELVGIKRELKKIRYELVDNEHAHWRGTERMLYVMGFAIFLLLLLIVLKMYSGALKVETQ